MLKAGVFFQRVQVPYARPHGRGEHLCDFSKISFYFFISVPVTGIGLITFSVLVVTQMMVELSLEHLLDTTFVQLGKKALGKPSAVCAKT